MTAKDSWRTIATTGHVLKNPDRVGAQRSRVSYTCPYARLLGLRQRFLDFGGQFGIEANVRQVLFLGRVIAVE